MMTKEEKLAFLNESFFTLRQRGIVRTQADFARLLGVLPTSLSTAKNGREDYLTEQLMYRIRDVLVRNGVTLPSEEKDAQRGISVPLETIDLFNSLSSTIERLTQEIERLNRVIENLSQDGKSVKRA